MSARNSKTEATTEPYRRTFAKSVERAFSELSSVSDVRVRNKGGQSNTYRKVRIIPAKFPDHAEEDVREILDEEFESEDEYNIERAGDSDNQLEVHMKLPMLKK